MIILTEKEMTIAKAIKRLKDEAGSHSPSVHTIAEKLPELKINIDACYLSNPYATGLFLRYLTEEIIDTNKMRDLLEFYPSQNQVIAGYLSEHLKVPAENIFIGNGATEIIQGVIHNFTTQKIIVNIPTFSPYYEFVKDGVEVVFNKLDKQENFTVNLEKYIQLVEKERPDTIVLINPNNPDGGYINLTDIKDLLTRLSWVENIIIDESFIHFAFECATYELKSTTELTQEFKNLILIKSMSKDFGIAGVRAGYAVMDENKVNHLLNNGYLWNLSGLSEYFFKLYVRHEFLQEYEQERIRYIRESQQYFSELGLIPGLKVYPSMANFALIELLNEAKAVDFVSKMLIKHGVYTRDCLDKIGLDGEFIRISSRTEPENKIIVAAIKDVLQNVQDSTQVYELLVASTVDH